MNYIIPNKENYRQYKYNKRYHIYKSYELLMEKYLKKKLECQ